MNKTKYFSSRFSIFIIGVFIAGTIVLFRSWAASLVLVCTIILLSLAYLTTEVRLSRFAVLFGLVSSVDFLKRIAFLLPDQDAKSQYLIYILPSLFFLIAFLVPKFMKSIRTPIRINKYLVLLLGWFSLNTWISDQTDLLAKAVATIFLILPWLMIQVASENRTTILIVGRTIIIFAILSTLLGIYQFIFGPTIIETRWAEASREFSIGAMHTEAYIYNIYGGFNVYRPIGLQADAFTFGTFLINGLLFLWILRMQNRISKFSFISVSFLLLIGILLSLVRTIWIGAIFFIAYSWLAKRWHFLSNPLTIVFVLVILFYSSNIIARLLYSFSSLSATLVNPILGRAFTFGTLADRIEAVSSFWNNLPQFLISGYGLAASEWITTKFGGFNDLPINFGKHNVLVEYLWYVGVFGLALIFLTIYNALKKANKVLSNNLKAVTVAYLLAMFLIGQGNGSAFMNLTFFYFIGWISSNNPQVQDIRS